MAESMFPWLKQSQQMPRQLSLFPLSSWHSCDSKAPHQISPVCEEMAVEDAFSVRGATLRLAPSPQDPSAADLVIWVCLRNCLLNSLLVCICTWRNCQTSQCKDVLKLCTSEGTIQKDGEIITQKSFGQNRPWPTSKHIKHTSCNK